MSLQVLGTMDIKDGMPDLYLLRHKNGKYYEFIPHNGIRRLADWELTKTWALESVQS